MPGCCSSYPNGETNPRDPPSEAVLKRAAQLEIVERVVEDTILAPLRTKTAQVPILERMSPNAWLEMNPVDAKRLKLAPHDKVRILSRRGEVSGVELRITEITAPGQVFMPFHFSETNVNEVTQDAFDPISREPNYKQCAVNVERV